MSVIEFREAIRARLRSMADDHMAMQEAVPFLPPSRIVAHLAAMDAHAKEMSALASRLYEDSESEFSRKGAKAQSSEEPEDDVA